MVVIYCLHVNISVYLFPLVNRGIEASSIYDGVWNWQFVQQYMHPVRVGSGMELLCYIICIIPFAAVCQYGVNDHFVAVKVGRAMPETLEASGDCGFVR